jgi:hypothetical protein
LNSTIVKCKWNLQVYSKGEIRGYTGNRGNTVAAAGAVAVSEKRFKNNH